MVVGGWLFKRKERGKPMEEKIKWLLSGLLGLIGVFTRQYGILIVLVAVAIIFDIVTGLIKAKIHENISSKKGTKGMFKKVSILFTLFFGFFLDYAITYICGYVSIEIPFNLPFGMIIGFYIILNECISICENLYACNPNIMPTWIVKMLQATKDKFEDGGKNEDSEEK